MGIGLERREPIIIRPNVFKGNLYLSIRKFQSWEGNITYPTSKGIEIPWDEARAVIRAIQAVIGDLESKQQITLDPPEEDELPF